MLRDWDSIHGFSVSNLGEQFPCLRFLRESIPDFLNSESTLS